MEFGESIPLGVLFRTERPIFEEQFPVLRNGPLGRQEVSAEALRQVKGHYFP
jgi:2-oxoglutarate/2-oxoacid ferredoxin oxidoreductase subunit beta